MIEISQVFQEKKHLLLSVLLIFIGFILSLVFYSNLLIENKNLNQSHEKERILNERLQHTKNLSVSIPTNDSSRQDLITLLNNVAASHQLKINLTPGEDAKAINLSAVEEPYPSLISFLAELKTQYGVIATKVKITRVRAGIINANINLIIL